MSLRLRLTFAAAILLAVILLLGFLLISSVSSSELRQVDQQLKYSLPVARTIDESAIPSFHPGATPPRSFNANRVSAFYIAAITNGKRSVISTPLDAKHEAPQIPSAVSTPHHDPKIFTLGSVSGSLQWRAILIGEPHSNTDLLVAVSLAQIDTTMSFLRFAFLLAGLAILAVVAATGFWIARLGLRPIAEVTEVADAITAGDRTRRVTRAQQKTEAGKLANAFNVMLDEQLSLEARLRQFVADASHELRTPVSVILGITELWRQGELRNGEERDEAIHRIGLSGSQMGKLVEELLLLARLDDGRTLERGPVDLAALINEVVADVSITGSLQSISIDASDPVVVEGDGYGLRQVVANLINNALRYTSPDSTVKVRLSVDGEMALIDVVDSGPGMSEDEASHAFDRFWQASASRSRSGAGLGLSIVQGIVVAHGGTVTLQTDVITGTRVRVSIPRGETNRSELGALPTAVRPTHEPPESILAVARILDQDTVDQSVVPLA